MLARYVEIYDELIEVVENELATVRMDKTEGFASLVNTFCQMLSEINVVTKDLQTKGSTLSDYRYAVDTLMDVVYTSILYEIT